MHVLDSDTTALHLPFGDLITALRKGFGEGANVPVRQHHTLARPGEPDATLLLMPAWQADARPHPFLGIKIVTVFPANTALGIPGLTSTYMLYDAGNWTRVAILDGNAITARRTVACSALAAGYLACADSRRLTILGAGRVASLIAQAYREIRPIERVEVWDIDQDGAGRLTARLRDEGFDASAVTDLEASVRAADIVSSATLATRPADRRVLAAAGRPCRSHWQLHARHAGS